jgi:hypothetical protein
MSFRSTGQRGLSVIYTPEPGQLPRARDLTSGHKRTRSSRRYSHGQGEFSGKADSDSSSVIIEHPETSSITSQLSRTPSVVRQSLGLGSSPPLSHRADC